jgi:hypothetical protein
MGYKGLYVKPLRSFQDEVYTFPDPIYNAEAACDFMLLPRCISHPQVDGSRFAFARPLPEFANGN